jgi:GT2 family glycosyltransferase
LEVPAAVTEIRDVSVIVRTIGRPALLAQLLESLAACDPLPAEIVVVDQSRAPETGQVVARHVAIGARTVVCDRRGRSLAANVGIAEARHAIVLLTDDDCLVAPDWVGVGYERLAGHPDLCLCGRLLPLGDPRAVPSRLERREPADWTGRPLEVNLLASNMGCHRDAAGEVGFDEGLHAMEDWDFGVRWLRRGRRLHYEPRLLAYHDDWREPEDVERAWVEYGEGCGLFYAKLLRRGDPLALSFALRDLQAGAAALGARLLYGPRWWDGRLGVVRGMARGLAAGLRRQPSGGKSG